MTPETLEALRDSIGHWRSNLSAESPRAVDTSSAGCALCRNFHWLYDGISHDQSCGGCPVMGRTGKQFCDGSPYYEAEKAHENWLCEKADRGPLMNAFRKAAQAELDFLISLLPEGETP